jgi:hypothetical protein
MWKILARHKRWVERCTISESINEATEERRFSATIDGWQNWRLLVVQQSGPEVAQRVIEMAREILERIDAGDEEVFEQAEQAW